MLRYKRIPRNRCSRVHCPNIHIHSSWGDGRGPEETANEEDTFNQSLNGKAGQCAGYINVSAYNNASGAGTDFRIL